MSKELEIKQEINGMLTIDSREVAEMMEKNHSAVMKDIQGSKDCKSVGIIPVLLKSNFDVSKYFIESSYKDGSGKSNKCYLCTKMGCELLGNKQQGEKGILFTAKYVERFNVMENKLKESSEYKLPITYKEALLQLVEQVEKNEQLELENGELKEQNKLKDLENRLLSGEVFAWADTSLINSLVRTYSTSVYGDFSKGWTDFKKSLLYSHSINLNSRITAYLNKTSKKTKPKTLSMLKGQEEISKALSTIISMCNEESVDISNNLKHHLEGDK